MLNRRGAGLVDTLLAILLIAAAGIVFSATFPAGFTAVRQAAEYKEASAMAQRKVEQAKALGFENLSYANMRSVGIVDQSPTSSPYTFTDTDSLADNLAIPAGTLSVTDVSTYLKLVTSTVSWSAGGIRRSVVVRTLVADKRIKRRT